METMVNLKTWLNGGSLFTAIRKYSNFPFFTEVSTTELDQMLVLMYGGRIMSSSCIGVNITLVARLITVVNGKKWLALYNFINDNTIDLGAREVIKTEGSENTVGTKVDVSTSENKVSAFNSDDLITDTGSENKLDENTTKGVNNVETVSVSDWQTVFNNLSAMERTNIISVVLKDVASCITVSVYP